MKPLKFWHDIARFIGCIFLSLLCGACTIGSHADLAQDLKPDFPLSEGLYTATTTQKDGSRSDSTVMLHRDGPYYFTTSLGKARDATTPYGDFLRFPGHPDYWILETFKLMNEKDTEIKYYWLVKIENSNRHAKILYINYERMPADKRRDFMASVPADSGEDSSEHLIPNFDKIIDEFRIKNDGDTYDFLKYILDNNLIIEDMGVQRIEFSKVENDNDLPLFKYEQKPNLHALVVGVSDYRDGDLKLTYAAKDARDFAKGLDGLKGGLYANVDVTTLVDGDATHDHILEQLDILESHAVSRDINMIFISGHGFADLRGNYWFLPVDATPDTIRIKGISQDEIRRTLQDLAGKSLLFLDTCHAGRVASMEMALKGAVNMHAVVEDFARVGKGVTTFASSIGSESSQESAAWGNGAFTKALMEGLFDGRADDDHTGTITSFRLETYLEDRVKELTGGRQHPVMEKPPGVPDFPIALSGR